MSIFNLRPALALFAGGLAACGLAACGSPPPPSRAAGTAPVAREQLSRVVDGYWDAHLQLNPLTAAAAGDHRYDDRLGNPISARHLADTLALERRALSELAAVPQPLSDNEARLTFEIFRRGRELAVEGLIYPGELLLVNPFDGMPQQFALLARNAGPHVPAAGREWDDWSGRSDDYARWTLQAISNLRDGVRRGYVQPAELVERLLPQIDILSRDTHDNVFYEPLRGGAGERYQESVRSKVLPAYRELRDFLKSDYLPAAQSAAPWRAWPLHQAWYGYLIRRYTSMRLSPQDLKRTAQAEAGRLRERLEALQGESAARPPVLSRTDLLAAYEQFGPTIFAALGDAFGPATSTAYTVRSVEGFRETSAPPVSLWLPPADAPTPPVLYVNAYGAVVAANPGREALFMGAVGQADLRQSQAQWQLAALPRFRRYGDEPAFVEGWALYVETVGEELGVYRDTGALHGALFDEWRHAAAAVVDIGLHAEGWSRSQALEYLHSQLAASDDIAADIVDRCLAAPGQALAAPIGALNLLGLRHAAQERLGTRFQNAAFHQQILAAGPLPLDLLDHRMADWIESNR